MSIQFTRLPGYDINGNPRYVCHFVNLLTKSEKIAYGFGAGNWSKVSTQYKIAVKRANKIGGRKYHTKAYGGGIVFTDYESVIREHIKRIVEEAEHEQGK